MHGFGYCFRDERRVPAAATRLHHELHSDPASDTTASHAGQKRRKGASTPATGANTTPLNTTDKQHLADPTQPNVDKQSATAQQPSSLETVDD